MARSYLLSPFRHASLKIRRLVPVGSRLIFDDLLLTTIDNQSFFHQYLVQDVPALFEKMRFDDGRANI
jgi:hypothetical protein